MDLDCDQKQLSSLGAGRYSVLIPHLFSGSLPLILLLLRNSTLTLISYESELRLTNVSPLTVDRSSLFIFVQSQQQKSTYISGAHLSPVIGGCIGQWRAIERLFPWTSLI